MAKPDSTSRRSTKYRVEWIGGSTFKAVAAQYNLLAAKPPNRRVYVRRIIFDSGAQSPADLVGSADGSCLAPGDIHIPADKPQDSVSVNRAVEEGLIRSADESNRQSQVPDNDGSGGIPREGHERNSMHAAEARNYLSQHIQRTIQYETRLGLAASGEGTGYHNARVPIHALVSTIGGTGNGSVVWFVTEGILPCAQASGVEAKVVPELLSLGNLQVPDREQARLNQFLAFKFVQALATGAQVDAVTQRILPVPFDHVRVFSNMNNGGAIGSLRGLVHHQAQLQRFLWDTPGGVDMQEREPDIEHWGYGEFEDPLCVYTASVACIHWNKSRLLDSLAYRGAKLLAERFLAEANRDQIITEAASLAAAANLIESDEQSQLTIAVSHPEELAGESVYGRAEQDIMNAIAGTKGVERGDALCERIPLVRDESTSIYGPQMCSKAQHMVETAEDALNRRLDQTLRQPQGLSQAITLLQCMQSTTDRSRQAIATKISEIQEFLASHEHALAKAAEQLQELAEQGRLRRSLSFQAIRAINAVLEESGRAATNYHLQIEACTVATENVLVPLDEFIERRLAELLATRQSLAELTLHCGNMARHKAEERTVEDPAVGLELVTQEYVESYFADHLARRGGLESFVDQLRGLFLQWHGSFDILVGASLPQMEASLLEVCRSVFEPGLENTNVLAEFRRVYPDEGTQRAIITELIGQCEGRLVVEGEINKLVAWIKTANVPAPDQAEWMRRMLESTDHKAGKWQVAVHPADPETFSMAQLRGEISLTNFINRLGIEDTYENWSRLIDRAADPVSAIGVGPNPTPRQFRRVLAKAISAGLLTVDTNGHFVFRSSTDEQWPLGTDARTVWEGLQPHFRQLSFAESYWASTLVDSEQEVVAKLNEIKAQLQGSASDKLFGLTDATAIEESLQQAKLLGRWAKQTRKRRKKVAV